MPPLPYPFPALHLPLAKSVCILYLSQYKLIRHQDIWRVSLKKDIVLKKVIIKQISSHLHLIWVKFIVFKWTLAINSPNKSNLSRSKASLIFTFFKKKKFKFQSFSSQPIFLFVYNFLIEFNSLFSHKLCIKNINTSKPIYFYFKF